MVLQRHFWSPYCNQTGGSERFKSRHCSRRKPRPSPPLYHLQPGFTTPTAHTCQTPAHLCSPRPGRRHALPEKSCCHGQAAIERQRQFHSERRPLPLMRSAYQHLHSPRARHGINVYLSAFALIPQTEVGVPAELTTPAPASCSHLAMQPGNQVRIKRGQCRNQQ
jgi:hypothetical protein